MSRMAASLKKNATGYLFISPYLIGFFAFTFFPILYSFGLSFTDWNVLQPANFIGLDNYKTLVGDEKFWASLKVTFIYSFISVPLLIILGILLAALLNQKIKGMRFFRTLFYMPAVVSGVAVAMLWMWIFDSNFGIINIFLSWFGIEGPHWLTSPRTALSALIIMSLWGVGGNMVIYLAGLQGIPVSLYEAAEVDGAGRIQKFIHITLPMLTPTIFFTLILGIIGSFQVFTQALVMTNGGPGTSTLFYVLYLYQNAFEFFKMGYASTLGWVLFLIVFVFVLILFGTAKFWVHYEFDLGSGGQKRSKARLTGLLSGKSGKKRKGEGL